MLEDGVNIRFLPPINASNNGSHLVNAVQWLEDHPAEAQTIAEVQSPRLKLCAISCCACSSHTELMRATPQPPWQHCAVRDPVCAQAGRTIMSASLTTSFDGTAGCAAAHRGGTDV